MTCICCQNFMKNIQRHVSVCLVKTEVTGVCSLVTLQCILTSRVQEAYSSLSSADSQKYWLAKPNVLKVYELVPEAYCQCFWICRKGNKHPHLKIVHYLTAHFMLLHVLKMDNFETWCDLVLEQLKNSIPEHITTLVNKR